MIYLLLLLAVIAGALWAAFLENEEFCPVCGYYCLGKGGVMCIDKSTSRNSDFWKEPML